tara:strand:+ start:1416 stop:1637 length:222 start_codon:yes stop_codon:yes gene_type:complete
MKVEILRQVMISGEPAMAGSILEVSDENARILLGLGKAVEFKGEAAVKEEPSEEEAPSAPPKKTTTRKRTKES